MQVIQKVRMYLFTVAGFTLYHCNYGVSNLSTLVDLKDFFFLNSLLYALKNAYKINLL